MNLFLDGIKMIYYSPALEEGDVYDGTIKVNELE